MSFLSDAVLPSSTSVYLEGITSRKNGQRTLRKSRSHGGLFGPLVQLVRDPIRSIGDAVGSLGTVQEDESPPQLLDNKRRQMLYLRMKNAESYEEWKAAATELDALEGNDVWKLQDESPEYDFALIAARLKQLDDARVSCDVDRMVFLIRTSLTRGLGRMGDLRLYKHSHIGTKALIEHYIESAEKTLAALLEVSDRQDGNNGGVKRRKLLESLLAARQSFGRSALLLSGGGTFGMNHIGVVKSLWEARLLPRIISGASAGSIVCAVLCIKTDVEMAEGLTEFCFGDLAVFDKEGEEDGVLKKAARFLKYGSLFDISHLTRVMKDLLGDMTFQEAYNRTRRILNITVSSASLYELPRLLNYVTAPNVIIWSAVCASCSVPLVFSAASLLAKDPKTGKEVPWNPVPNGGWIDGSVDNDLPMTRLAEMFNVNHFIVSQVNPHVVPFLAKEEESIGNGAEQPGSASATGPTWIHNIAGLAKSEALHRLHVLAELGVFPNYLTKARSVLNQRYSGDITIFPTISYTHFPKILSNPTTEYMLQCLITGERATWPKLSRVKNHVAIELALDETIRQLRARLVFSPSQVDLRLNNIGRPVSQGDESGSRTRRGLRKKTRFAAGTAPSTPSIECTSSRATPSYFNLTPDPHNTKPYLPFYPMGKYSQTVKFTRPIESSTLPRASHDPGLTTDGSSSIDNETSVLMSSPSPPGSPLSTTQNVSSTSHPGTPSIVSHVFSHQDRPPLLYLNQAMEPARMAKTGPSSPERRYNRLFHPTTGVTELEHFPIQGGILQDDSTSQTATSKQP